MILKSKKKKKRRDEIKIKHGEKKINSFNFSFFKKKNKKKEDEKIILLLFSVVFGN